jgi:Na+-translocating ferredoxin:NAD+ oxidoreductase RnfD subunit
LAVVLLLITGGYVADRVNKLPCVFAFLGAYFALFTLSSFFIDPARVAEVFRAPDLGAVLFFALFMLDDPPTSPIRYTQQIIFGLIVAGVSHYVFVISGAVCYLLVGLLVANAWEAYSRVNQRKMRQA